MKRFFWLPETPAGKLPVRLKPVGSWLVLMDIRAEET
jgi:hypothetical protein